MHVAICRTVDCENEGVAVEVAGTGIDPITEEVVPVVRVQCGPCGQPITDITPPLPEVTS